jgi:hypothetical protein
MCYGDPAWGRDGYMEQEMLRGFERQQYEEQERSDD